MDYKTMTLSSSSRSLPGYLRIAHRLEREIGDGKWAPGACFPPEQTLAKKTNTDGLPYTKGALFHRLQRWCNKEKIHGMP